MKAVVLARGLGTRMKAGDERAVLSAEQASVADSGVKALVPVAADRPFLDYVLSALADAGCDEIALVIGPEHDGIRDRYTKVLVPQRFRIAFAIQEKPRGTGDALLAAEGFVSGEEFLVVNSDNYYPVEVLKTLVNMGRPGTVFFTPHGLAEHSNIEPSRVLAFALGKVGGDGALDALVEKPDRAALTSLREDGQVSMNCWRFPPSIFDACRRLTPSVRGELELTDAITMTIAGGVRFEVRTSPFGVLDLSRRGDIPAVRERLRGVAVRL
ncbi:MAG: nucleotidyltransferase family protein [Vicinamibacteria bacterium]